MGLKKNIGYNTLLTISNYLIPLVVFPYVSRVLGVDNLGLYSFADSVINYFILFSMMGINTIGIREIARIKNNPNELRKNFSSLFILNSITTVIALLLFVSTIYLVPQFYEHKKLFYIGGAKILANLFLIEWLYNGMENFKFITIRTIIIKLIYVITVFIFVKHQEDYEIFYALTVGSVILNGIVNWLYSKKITSFSLESINFKPFIKPYFILGLYGLLTSMYTTFNIIYLGFVSDEKEVGFYTAATKIMVILLSLYTAYSNVVMPHVSKLIASNKMNEVKSLINKSIEALYIFCIPIIYISVAIAPEIIHVFSGSGYEGAILPMRIIMPLILVVGLEQILIIQILTPLRKDNSILTNSIFGALTGLVLNILIVSKYSSVGSSIVWFISELAVLSSAYFFVRKSTDIKIDFSKLFKNLILGIPYILICIFVVNNLLNPFLIIGFSLLLSFIYFLFVQIKIIKNDLILNLLKRYNK